MSIITAENSVPSDEDISSELPLSEVDLTGRRVEVVHEHLSDLLTQGFVLHGSPNPDLSQLEPHPNFLAGTSASKEAVFATDNPIIAMANGVAGGNFTSWHGGITYGIDIESCDFPDHAYVYILPPNNFTRSSVEPSELFSPEVVPPVGKIVFDSSVITPAFRPSADLIPTVDGDDVLESLANRGDLTSTDHLLAVLTLKNLTNLMPYMDYSVSRNSPNYQYFERLYNQVQKLSPVFTDLHSRGDPTIKDMFLNWYRNLYYMKTYDIDSNYSASEVDKSLVTFVKSFIDF